MGNPSQLLLPAALVVALAGCDFQVPSFDFTEDPVCESRAQVVDEVAGSVQFELQDDGACEPGEVPNAIEFGRIEGGGDDPLSHCGRGYTILYSVHDLTRDELGLTLFDEGPGRVIYREPDQLEDGDWIQVTYWRYASDVGESLENWGLLFQYGVPGTAFSTQDCYTGE